MKSEPFACMRDDLCIRGRVFSTDQDTSPRPAVILSHGFLANQSMCRTYAKLLTRLGYVAIIFDFCGGGLRCSSDGKSQDMTLFTEKDDLLAVIEHVRALPIVDGHDVSLLGCSQGGLVSALVASERPNEVSRLLLLYPALCIPDDARAGHMMSFRFDPNNVPDIIGRLPMRIGGDYARSVMAMDVFKEIGGFEGPTLYIQGDEDKIVDVRYARRAHKLYPNCRYEEIAGGGHMFRGEADRHAQEIIRDFMA